MYLFKRESDIKEYLAFQRSSGYDIGFAPTMGALHQGHLSLLKQAKAENDLTVCSIFVNPTQFNKADDLELYPRTPAKDLDLLLQVGCDALFFPTVSEVYPEGQDTRLQVELGHLTTVMEGVHRPGHFEGVVQVVHRLLDIIKPTRLYMGEKDFQQYTIIRSMANQLKLPTEVIGVPIVRAESGLALSSRNVRLSKEGGHRAAKIYQTLLESKAMVKNYSPIEIQAFALKKLSAEGFAPEYFEIVNKDTLLAVTEFEPGVGTIACTAVWLEGVRLIDNLVLS